MKILHINSEKSWRGGEQQMANLMHQLSKHKVENIICCKTNSEFSAYAKKNNISFCETKFKGLKIKDALNIKRFVKKEKIDLIHTHSANAHTAAFYAAIFGMKTPIVVSKRTDFPVKTQWKFDHHAISKILCVSQKIAQITKSGMENKEKVFTVHSGINPERFNIEQIDLKKEFNITKPLIGNCSAIAPHKDYFTFAQVAKLMPEAQFIIMGDGPMEDEIKAYVKEQKIENIIFTGFLTDINKKLKSLDLFLMTSTTEGLGTSLLDAMLCEVPIVATRVGGIPEIVIHDKTGLSSKAKDVRDLAKNCKKILEDDELRARLVRNAKEQVLKDYTDEQTALKTLKHYKNILEA